MLCLFEWTAWKGAKHVWTRNKYNIVQIKCKTSFTYEGAKLWNELSQGFIEVLTSIENSKRCYGLF